MRQGIFYQRDFSQELGHERGFTDHRVKPSEHGWGNGVPERGRDHVPKATVS